MAVSPCEGEMAGNVYQVAVPSAWECYPDFEAYRGRASYTRRFKVERSGRIRLEFKGVSHTADVFVDGKLALTTIMLLLLLRQWLT